LGSLADAANAPAVLIARLAGPEGTVGAEGAMFRSETVVQLTILGKPLSLPEVS
jgi:hypothetical protein